jgi:hypothetical protein
MRQTQSRHTSHGRTKLKNAGIWSCIWVIHLDVCTILKNVCCVNLPLSDIDRIGNGVFPFFLSSPCAHFLSFAETCSCCLLSARATAASSLLEPPPPPLCRRRVACPLPPCRTVTTARPLTRRCKPCRRDLVAASSPTHHQYHGNFFIC